MLSKGAEQPPEYCPRTHPILDASRVHNHRQQVALRIYCDVPLAPLDLLARVITAMPPFSTVLADCESMIATVGAVFRPPALRPCSRGA